jgi:threonine dehydrogenase-like Zn-dependent dehydrogenase
MDLILDASGFPALEFNLLDALALYGAYVLTGIPEGDRPVQIPEAELIRQLVLNNQVMLGSVTAARDHFQMSARHLEQAHLRWGEQLNKLITQRYTPDQLAGSADHHKSDSIKQVVE